MRVAVTGAAGRLGRALVAALEDAPYTGPFGPIAWTRSELDLDRPEAIDALLDRDRPEVVIHSAAWTDVDGCARDPDLARRRNGDAVGRIAEATAWRSVDFVLISTNEIFDGRRTDGRGYSPADAPAPPNPYGASKLAGEQAATAAYRPDVDRPGAPGRAGAQLAIVRSAWLFGPGAPDYPAKILAAAERAIEAGEPLRAVGDEFGSPTYVADVADAIVELIGSGDFGGIHHIVNSGVASRADWARAVLGLAGIDVPVRIVPASTWTRASAPPPWGVLEPTGLPSGEPLRTWQDAMADYAPVLLRSRMKAGR